MSGAGREPRRSTAHASPGAARLMGAVIAAAIAVGLGVLAAWPIYQHVWLLVTAAAGLLLGAGVAWLSTARRWGVLATGGLLLGSFVLTVVPVAVPSSFERLPAGLWRGLIDGVAAIVLGWKQLLTITLPVGTYQTMLVPAYLVFLIASFTVVVLALRAGRFAPLGAFALLVPVAFGTIFGSSELSAPVALGPVTLAAPRELALWVAAGALGAAWVAWTASAERRAALRRGRQAGEPRVSGGRLARVGIAAATVVVGLVASLALAPALTGAREVPRDRVDPEIVVRERPSPLASYRAWKRDDTLDAEMFSVAVSGEGTGALPPRLRLAVLDGYDGVDFHVAGSTAGSFTRFPSGAAVADPVEVTVRIGEAYADIWAPTAQLASAPSFAGPNAVELADAFFVNRETGAAIAVPGATNGAAGGAAGGSLGLAEGDRYRATMSGAPDATLSGRAASDAPGIDLEAMPELAAWVEAQDVSATAEGLTELIERLRNRGYLSHAISDRDGERAWLERLAAAYGTRFESSPGGHSAARIEQMFAQLNTQQRLAGDDATDAMLVAAIGDDEQFAAAAALVAQALGFESRVVIGVRLSDDASSDAGTDAGVPGVPACTSSCTGEHLAAWVEVRGADRVWVPIDVTPQLQHRPTTLDEGEQLPEFPTTPEARDAHEVDPPLGVGERSEQTSQSEAAAAAQWWWPILRIIGLSLLALILVIVPFAFVPLAKRRRAKQRRREPEPELRALGAWYEMVDRALDDGVVIPPGATRREIAETLGTAPALWAAAQVDRAVFSPTSVTAADADWVWQAAEADRAERQTAQTRWQRLRAALSLRSLGVWFGARRAGAKESARQAAKSGEIEELT